MQAGASATMPPTTRAIHESAGWLSSSPEAIAKPTSVASRLNQNSVVLYPGFMFDLLVIYAV